MLGMKKNITRIKFLVFKGIDYTIRLSDRVSIFIADVKFGDAFAFWWSTAFCLKPKILRNIMIVLSY